jgi:hypothetical protein
MQTLLTHTPPPACAHTQFDAAPGTGNTLGWAATDTSGTLQPYKVGRRAVGAHDVRIQITHAGMCHSDVHTITGDWGPPKLPLVPGARRSCHWERVGGLWVGGRRPGAGLCITRPGVG